MNSIIAIHPYMTEGMWVFDDETVGLHREPFIAGADTIIEHMAADIPNARAGFTLLFSAEPFPGYQLELEWVRAEMSGNRYRSPALGMEGWLCPALLKYFASPPARLYAQFRAASPGKLPSLPDLHLGRYRHYKGGEYEVVGVARHSETLEPMILYRPLYNDTGLWVRPYEMFFETVEVNGKLQQRFAPLEVNQTPGAAR